VKSQLAMNKTLY